MYYKLFKQVQTNKHETHLKLPTSGRMVVSKVCPTWKMARIFPSLGTIRAAAKTAGVSPGGAGKLSPNCGVPQKIERFV